MITEESHGLVKDQEPAYQSNALDEYRSSGIDIPEEEKTPYISEDGNTPHIIEEEEISNSDYSTKQKNVNNETNKVSRQTESMVKLA